MDFKKIALIVALLAALSVFSTAVIAEDLTDNATCAECHEGGGSDEPMDVSGAKIHNPDGSFTQEAHEMWSCVDCHADITAIPHETDKERTVDCLQCHEETPE
jgi:hypothetical protein